MEFLLDLCISILEFKYELIGDLVGGMENLCISILEFKYTWNNSLFFC